ncbi:MAG: hypothetical protein OXU33_05570 [Gemmatimonadota bacterium]|nr:hypothetical protein [Gemmatimonadota bacterium]MDE3013521.1 hypothetical protein [Gemmatimonadota bacterium]
MGSDAGIQAGPVGRVLRLLTGVALVIEGGRHLIGTSTPLVAMTVGVVIGEIAFYAVMHVLISRFLRRVNPWMGALLAVAPVAAVFLMSDAPGRLGTLLFVGISLLFSAARAEGGCEVMTLPGMIFGSRTHLCCIAFSPIDWAEARIAKRRAGV